MSRRPTIDPSRPLVCRQFVEVASDYLERRLSEAEMLWTEEHLAACDACRAYLAQLRATIDSLRGLADSDLDAGRRESILAAMRVARPEAH
ncbi:MAG: zf-HC2 domain-containing protein [Actinomycetota bacterium]|nr:zf-HC2 domain-containing protein [Actinomycetota bacterium]